MVSFVAYFSPRLSTMNRLGVLPLSEAFQTRTGEKSTENHGPRREAYLRARPIPEDAPVTRAYPALSAALLTPPVGGGGEADDDDDDDDDDETDEVELLVTTDDDVVILRNAKSWSDA